MHFLFASVHPSFGERVRRTRMAATSTLELLDTLPSLQKVALGTQAIEMDLSIPVYILRRAQKTTTDIEGVAVLQERVLEFSNALGLLSGTSRTSATLQATLDCLKLLVQRWVVIGDRTRAARRRPHFIWPPRSDISADMLPLLIDDLNASVQAFLDEYSHQVALFPGDVSPQDAAATDEATKETEVQRTGKEIVVPYIVGNFEVIQDNTADVADMHNTTKPDAAFSKAPLLPRYTMNARHDASSVRRSCLRGTSISIFDKLRKWVTLACTESLLAGKVLWISGPAGTGKTTIAYSIADEFKGQGMLGGSFFCSRFDAECSDPNMVFTTISHQLCSIHEPFRTRVAAVLQESPDVVDAGPARQLEELIVRPLEEVRDTFPVCVIVIDALDECKDATSVILAVLAKFIHRLGRLLFIVTSRPDARIATFLETPGEALQEATTSLILDETRRSSVLGDIKLYLGHEFGATRQTFCVPEGWPSQQDIDALVVRSDGLWIHAVTTVKFVSDKNCHDPEGRLQLILADRPIPDRPIPDRPSLHSLYTQIANSVCSMASDELTVHTHSVLGVMAVSQEPLSIASFAGLLGSSEPIIRDALQGLHPVLDIPEDNYSPVRVSHPTFLEFLTSPIPSKPAAFDIEPAKHHSVLFRRCIDIMRTTLKYDICDIEDPTRFKEEISALPERIKQYIPHPLQYSCRHWVAHFAEAICVEDVNGSFSRLREFLHHHLLNWFEACSLLDALDTAASSIDEARRICQALAGPFLDLIPLLYDCRRFISTFASPINSAPLQVHHSALTLTPHRTLMSRLYSGALGRHNRAFAVRSGLMPNWSSCIDVFLGHGGTPVRSIAFSPDGSYFASGGEDSYIRVWRTTTRTLFLSIQCPASTIITALAFSPDGAHIASTLDDGTVRLWQTATGANVHILESSAKSLRFITYSSDGRRILSASGDGQVRLWDSYDGRALLTLEGAATARQAALSPDGSTIAYGAGQFLQMYHLSSAESESRSMSCDALMTTAAVTFAADGRHLAAATQIQISIWSYPAMTLLRSFDIFGAPCRMAFSSDGLQFCYGCPDGSVNLWRISNNVLHTIKAHDGPVHDIVWSPDSFQIVTAGRDGTIRVWDANLRPSFEETNYPFPATVAPSPSVLTPDQQERSSDRHRYIQTLATKASARQRRDAFEWSYITGRASAMSFRWSCDVLSPDGNLKVQIPPTDAVQIQDMRTGAVMPLGLPSGYVRSAAFAPNSDYLVIGSVMGSVEVRNTSWIMTAAHHGHNKSVVTCSFSSSGRLVVSGSDRLVAVFDIASNDIVRYLGPHQASIVDAAFGADDEHVLSQDSSHTFYLWCIQDKLPTLLCNFTFDNDAWLYVLDFCPDESSVCFHSGAERADTVSLWAPTSRAWPVYNVTDDGWVYEKAPGYTRRLGWILPSWRHPLGSESGQVFVLDDAEHRLVELDFFSSMYQTEIVA